MTLTQTVDIPADRRVRFDFEVPREIPEGKAQVEFRVFPFAMKEEKPIIDEDTPPLKCLIGVDTPRSDRLLGAAASKVEPPLKCLVGVDTSLVDSLVGIISNPENKTYDELRFEAMTEKYGEYFK
ncbi:MAG: hypothetical protein FWG89_01705 [Treponema sp.]|nr:hypothetical protein [Treponema sp.]